MILLDTHVLLWLLQGGSRLSARAWDRVEEAREHDGAPVSAMTFREVVMPADKRRLPLGRPPGEWAAVLVLPDFRAVLLDAATAADAGCLPAGIHGDPADRVIVATARAPDVPLLTVDAQIPRYAAAGHVRAEDARLRRHPNSPCRNQRRSPVSARRPSPRRYSQKRSPPSTSTCQ